MDNAKKLLGWALSMMTGLAVSMISPTAGAQTKDAPQVEKKTEHCFDTSLLKEAEARRLLGRIEGLLQQMPCEKGKPRVKVLTPIEERNDVIRFELSLDGVAVHIAQGPKQDEGQHFDDAALWLYNTLKELGYTHNLPVSAMKFFEGSKDQSEEPPQLPGYLRVNSKPSSNVWVDGQDIGLTTPIVKLSLSPGKHTVTLRNQRFRCEGSFKVSIKTGETTSLVRQLDCGG